MSTNSFSICIPRAVAHVTSEQVSDVFNHFFNGDVVARVDMVERSDHKTGEMFWLIFVHFKPEVHEMAEQRSKRQGNNDPKQFINDINNDIQSNIIYDKHWFWKCRLNKANKQVPAEATPSGPRLMTEKDETEFKEFQERREKIMAEAAKCTSQPDDTEALKNYLESGELNG